MVQKIINFFKKVFYHDDKNNILNSYNKVNNVDFRPNCLLSVKEFLINEGFKENDKLLIGLLTMMDHIFDYKEEGISFYPEILVTSNLESSLKPLLGFTIIDVSSSTLEIKEFDKIIKICSSLAVDGWVIYVEVNFNNINYGLVNSDILEGIPNLCDQLFQDPYKIKDKDVSHFYLKRLNQKSIKLVGDKNNISISFGLREDFETDLNSVNILVNNISKDLIESNSEKFSFYLKKHLNDEINRGNGFLIGIIKDDNTNMELIKGNISDGVYLKKPIDLYEYYNNFEIAKDPESINTLRKYFTLMKRMISNDGITIFTTKGRILGYRIFIEKKSNNTNKEGGGRLRAFDSMCQLNIFSCCFYKSHDGRQIIKIGS